MQFIPDCEIARKLLDKKYLTQMHHGNDDLSCMS